MTNKNIPSIDPSKENFTGIFDHILTKTLQQTDDMLPAMVVSYDDTTNMATIQPMISMITTGGDSLDRAMVSHVPVQRYGSGGFIVHAPIKAGDLGWIKSNDRDISLFTQSFNKTIPNTHRIKSFSDSVFIPDVMRGYTVEDNESLYIQNLAGTTKIKVSETAIALSVGGIKFEITSSGIAVTGGTITHDGVNIGKTHTHGEVTAGTSNTGVPH